MVAKGNASQRRLRATEVLARLKRIYPEAICELTHDSPFQLLAATILSAQCTDVRVNIVTPNLFAEYPSAELLAVADIGRVEELIRSTGFYQNKAKSDTNAQMPLSPFKLLKMLFITKFYKFLRLSIYK